MSRSEDEDNVPLAKLNRKLSTEEMDCKQKKRKKNDKEILVSEDKWKPEDCAQPIGELIRCTGEGEEKKSHYKKFEFDLKHYGLEDSVLLIPAVPNRKLYVAIIKDIYKQGKEGYLYLEVQWFYRLEEAEKKDGRNWEQRDSRDLFYSFHRDEVFAESVRNKCTVHFVPDRKKIPNPGPPQPDFIVQNVYDFVDKKLWKLTDKDFDEMQKNEVDFLVAKTMSRLGDLPDIETEQDTPMLIDSAQGWEYRVSFKMVLPTGETKERREAMNMLERNRWVEIQTGEFMTSPEHLSGKIEFSMLEVKSEQWKSGLIVKGVAIRPKNKES
ncbi:unnamed protein product [Arabidopsis arenosa]|uniref:BAH domain-containing protein n=1 Tax=Arabidopsis arenosa TaxID=38785 RepID=A0A8S2AW83_ARAAE|nr:unnamed protein product [Arabidopsis arenosa]